MSYFRSLVRRGSSRDDAIAVAVSAPVASEPTVDAGPVSRDLLDACELIEAELDSANASCRRQSTRATARSSAMIAKAQSIAREVTGVARSADGVSQDLAAVAAAGEELSVAGREIATQAARSSTVAQQAVTTSDEAAAAIATLGQAAAAIDHVTQSIAAIASRINLLALNATIEAARAGEAGRGFGVVASEVKELSRQTAAATKDIAARIQTMRQATSNSVAAVRGVGHAVRDMDAANMAVTAAIEEQDATLREIASRLQTVSAHTSSVAETIGHVAVSGRELTTLSEQAHADTALTDARLEELRGSVSLVLRRMAVLGDDWNGQVPIQTEARLDLRSWAGTVTVLELSERAALIRLAPAAENALATASQGGTAVLDMGALGQMAGTVVAVSNGRLLMTLQARADTAVADYVARVRADDRRFTGAAQAAAARITAALEQAVRSGELTLPTLFDQTYAPVAGSDPAQFTTSFSAHADRLVQPILDGLLGFDPGVIGAFVVDRSGYAPTHNQRVSHPQRSGDAEWNAKHSRNRRMFDDRAGLAAGRNTRDVLIQSYERDMGGGERMMIKEADAPIHVGGRHWGGFRLMFLNGKLG